MKDVYGWYILVGMICWVVGFFTALYITENKKV